MITDTITEGDTGRLLVSLRGGAIEYLTAETIAELAEATAQANGYQPIDKISVMRGSSLEVAYVTYGSYTK